MIYYILISGKAQSGKNTFARLFEEHAKIYTVKSSSFVECGLPYKTYTIAFADPIKKIAKEQFGWDGQKDDKGRILLQVIGTEAGRNYDKDIWVKRLLKDIHHKLEKDGACNAFVLVPDFRFPNEYETLKYILDTKYDEKYKIVTVRINYDKINKNDKHPSEIALDNWNKFDYIIKRKDGNYDNYISVINNILKELKEN